MTKEEISCIKKESQVIVDEINDLAKRDRYRANFLQIENASLLNREHFNELAKMIYASDIVFDISLPNEIFIDLTTCKEISKWEHRAFALSFYYLVAYLWRSNIHYHVGDKMLLSQTRLKYLVTGIKESPTYNYLVKNNGILTKMGYTQKIFDIPVEYEYYKKNLVHVKMLSDLKAEGTPVEPLPKKLLVHKPLKGYYKYPKVKANKSQIEEMELDGHFFSHHQTFKVKAETFLAIITTKELGFHGFYFYCYLRYLQEVKGKNNGKGNKASHVVKKGFKKGKPYMALELGMSEKIIQRFISKLKAMNLIESEQLAFMDYNTFLAKYDVKTIKLL